MGPGLAPGGNRFTPNPLPNLPPQGPKTPGQPMLPQPPAIPGGSDAEHRIEQLEKKLHDLEKLIRELKKQNKPEEQGGAPPQNPRFRVPSAGEGPAELTPPQLR